MEAACNILEVCYNCDTHEAIKVMSIRNRSIKFHWEYIYVLLEFENENFGVEEHSYASLLCEIQPDLTNMDQLLGILLEWPWPVSL